MRQIAFFSIIFILTVLTIFFIFFYNPNSLTKTILEDEKIIEEYLKDLIFIYEDGTIVYKDDKLKTKGINYYYSNGIIHVKEKERVFGIVVENNNLIKKEDLTLITLEDNLFYKGNDEYYKAEENVIDWVYINDVLYFITHDEIYAIKDEELTKISPQSQNYKIAKNEDGVFVLNDFSKGIVFDIKENKVLGWYNANTTNITFIENNPKFFIKNNALYKFRTYSLNPEKILSNITFEKGLFKNNIIYFYNSDNILIYDLFTKKTYNFNTNNLKKIF